MAFTKSPKPISASAFIAAADAKAGEDVKLNFFVCPELAAAFKAACEERDEPMSRVLRRFMREYVAQG